MWYALLALAILGVGCVFYVLRLKSSADKLPGERAKTRQAAEKAEALEKTADSERQSEHDEDHEEAKEVLESGSRERAIGFLLGSVRRAKGPS